MAQRTPRMSNLHITRRIKYQNELDLGFGKVMTSIPGAEDLLRCIQCGTCSSTCPLSIYMDHTPRKIIAMTRAGFKDEVLSSATIWLCASCYSCTVDCPKKIKITDVMYALKRKAIEEKVWPRGLPIPVLAKEFFASVLRTGRANEGRTVAKVWLKTRPLKLLANMGLGLRLMARGRMSMKSERMTGSVDQLRKILDSVHNSDTGHSPG
ncbi:MAG: 4Fe-4S dicluster domain-containing protein [Phycisphaerales bacterium]|nr:MAG: 4Fe-4S dicluster domain-containing protein [Phycisphaerales bacterium]